MPNSADLGPQKAGTITKAWRWLALRNRRVFALFLLALTLRLLHVVLLHHAHPELVLHPVLDAAHYHDWARDILANTGLATRTFFMHPVYPHVMAVIYALTGPRPLAVILFQCVLGACSTALLYDLARDWVGERAALVAGVGFALFLPVVLDDALLETVSTGLCLMLASVWLCQNANGRPSRLILAGVVFVLAGLCRGNLLLAAPALFVSAFLRNNGSWMRRALGTWPVAVGIGLVLFVVGARNRVVGGEWVLTTTGSGPPFYLGNYRGAVSGGHEPPPFLRPDPKYEETDYKAEAERRMGRPLALGEVSRFWRDRAFEDLAAAPGFAAVRFLRKLGLALGAYEISDNYNLAYIASLTPVGAIPLLRFGWIVGFIPLGIALLWRRRRQLSLLLGVAALYWLSLGVFYVSSRLRIYLVPWALVFASVGALWLLDAWRARQWRAASLATASVLVVAWLSAFITPASVQRHEWAQALASHALVLVSEGKPVQGEALQREALALDPNNPFLLLNMGVTASRAADFASAAKFCRHATALRPQFAEAWSCLGVAQANSGNLPAAETALRQAAALDHDGPESRFNLAVLWARTGRREQAHQAFTDILAAYPNHAGAQRGLEMTR